MKNKRFLVVDDERSVADFVRTVIELEGGIVVIAATAASARERLRLDGPFDLMVLDLALPDGWGPVSPGRLKAGPPQTMVALQRLRTRSMTSLVVGSAHWGSR